MQLSEHFKLSEFINSPTAKARGIDNTPTVEVVTNLTRICKEILEPLREYAGQPIIIGSGYRCPALNKAVGGVPQSQHQYGEACDIHLPDEQTGREWFLWIMDNLHFDSLIWEKATSQSTRHWIHVSFKANGQQRQRVICNLIKTP